MGAFLRSDVAKGHSFSFFCFSPPLGLSTRRIKQQAASRTQAAALRTTWNRWHWPPVSGLSTAKFCLHLHLHFAPGWQRQYAPPPAQSPALLMARTCRPSTMGPSSLSPWPPLSHVLYSSGRNSPSLLTHFLRPWHFLSRTMPNA